MGRQSSPARQATPCPPSFFPGLFAAEILFPCVLLPVIPKISHLGEAWIPTRSQTRLAGLAQVPPRGGGGLGSVPGDDGRRRRRTPATRAGGSGHRPWLKKLPPASFAVMACVCFARTSPDGRRRVTEGAKGRSSSGWAFLAEGVRRHRHGWRSWHGGGSGRAVRFRQYTARICGCPFNRI
jgi:hypothetical protein